MTKKNSKKFDNTFDTFTIDFIGTGRTRKKKTGRIRKEETGQAEKPNNYKITKSSKDLEILYRLDEINACRNALKTTKNKKPYRNFINVQLKKIRELKAASAT